MSQAGKVMEKAWNGVLVMSVYGFSFSGIGDNNKIDTKASHLCLWTKSVFKRYGLLLKIDRLQGTNTWNTTCFLVNTCNTVSLSSVYRWGH